VAATSISTPTSTPQAIGRSAWWSAHQALARRRSAGKSSVTRRRFWEPHWPADKPIIDAIAPEGDFNAVTGALGSVGLGSVPTWLRPYPVLSNGEKFRADLARLVCDAPERAIVDEFTSVVDRQIAKFGALAFAKAWRRLKGKQVVLLTPHYDVVEWLEPDWVFDTAKRGFARGLLRRPQFDLEIWKTDGSLWPLFEPHHYLKLPRMVGVGLLCRHGRRRARGVIRQ
jgi:hypothetical protein